METFLLSCQTFRSVDLQVTSWMLASHAVRFCFYLMKLTHALSSRIWPEDSRWLCTLVIYWWKHISVVNSAILQPSQANMTFILTVTISVQVVSFRWDHIWHHWAEQNIKFEMSCWHHPNASCAFGIYADYSYALW